MYPLYTCYFEDNIFTAYSIDAMLVKRKELIDQYGFNHGEFNATKVKVGKTLVGIIIYDNKYCHVDHNVNPPIQTLPIS